MKFIFDISGMRNEFPKQCEQRENILGTFVIFREFAIHSQNNTKLKNHYSLAFHLILSINRLVWKNFSSGKHG